MASDIQPDMTAIPSGSPGAQGPTGSTGATGATGAAGANAYTTLSASFVQPSVGATVTATVGSTAWMAASQPIYLETGGHYEIAGIGSSTVATFRNLGYSGNAAVGANIAGGVKIVPSGARGATGADGDDGSAGTDSTAIHDNVAGEIAAIASKTSPTTSDILLLEDAAATNAKKKATFGALPISTATQTALDTKQAQSDTLDDIAAMTAGIVAVTASGAASQRTITGGEGIAVTDGDGAAGDPTLRVRQPVMLGGDIVSLGATGDLGVFPVSSNHTDYCVTEMVLWNFSAVPDAGLTMTLRDTSGAGGNSLLGSITGLNTIATTSLGARITTATGAITAIRHIDRTSNPNLYLNVSVANGTALTCQVAVFGYYLPTYSS